MKNQNGIHAAEKAVLRFEARKKDMSLKKFLSPINNTNIKEIIKSENLWDFTNRICGLTRRVESAAWVYENKSKTLVVKKAKLLKEKNIIKAILAMRRKVKNLKPKSSLEKVGKEFILYKFDWALKIIKKSLPIWGY